MLLAVETIQGDLYVNVKQCESSGRAGGLSLGIVISDKWYNYIIINHYLLRFGINDSTFGTLIVTSLSFLTNSAYLE